MWMLVASEYNSHTESVDLDAEFFATCPEAETRATERLGDHVFIQPTSCKIFEVNVGDWIDIYKESY